VNASTREGYGEELVELGARNEDVVVLEADISVSTKTCYFARRFPQRFVNVGVAEQNEVMIAAGMATCGLLPFVSTYAVFASMRCCEQIRSFVCYPRLNVKFGVSHGGLTACTDGVTHQATEDIAIVRAMPNMTVLVPSDYHMTRAAVRAAASIDGPVYIRLCRDPLPVIYDSSVRLEIGRSVTLREGDDVTIIAAGDMVSAALDAVEMLSAESVHARLIDMPCIKPIDEEAIIKAARETRTLVTVENHQIAGGLGSAVAEVVVENAPVPVRRLGLRDTFGESGQYALLLQKYRFSARDIANACAKAVREKKR